MDYDFTTLPAQDRYRLLTNFVGPRPVALITTRAADGKANAAPMSFFNVFSHDPAIVIIGVQRRPDGQEKDTVANLRREGEFVAHMVDMALSQAMLVCGLPFASDVDELEMAQLATLPAQKLRAVRIAEAPCAMECRVERIIDWPNRSIVLGEVVAMNVRDDCLDAAGRYVNPARFQPIARLHADRYIVADRQFDLKPPPIADFLAK